MSFALPSLQSILLQVLYLQTAVHMKKQTPFLFGPTWAGVYIKLSQSRTLFLFFSPRGRPRSSSPSRPSPWCWHCWRWWRGGQQAEGRRYRPDARRRDQAPAPEASRHSGTISSARWGRGRNSSVGHTSQNQHIWALNSDLLLALFLLLVRLRSLTFEVWG